MADAEKMTEEQFLDRWATQMGDSFKKIVLSTLRGEIVYGVISGEAGWAKGHPCVFVPYKYWETAGGHSGIMFHLFFRTPQYYWGSEYHSGEAKLEYEKTDDHAKFYERETTFKRVSFEEFIAKFDQTR